MPEAIVKKRERTCIGCGEQSGKTSLIRIVRLTDGQVAYDPTGRVAGRGAYACSAECLRKALGAKKLQRALKTAIRGEDAERILAEVEKTS